MSLMQTLQGTTQTRLNKQRRIFDDELLAHYSEVPLYTYLNTNPRMEKQ